MKKLKFMTIIYNLNYKIMKTELATSLISLFVLIILIYYSVVATDQSIIKCSYEYDKRFCLGI